MVQINKKTNQIEVSIPGDISDLTSMQTALMDLIQNYNFNDSGICANNTFFYAINLLQALTPDTDQQENGIKNRGQH